MSTKKADRLVNEALMGIPGNALVGAIPVAGNLGLSTAALMGAALKPGPDAEEDYAGKSQHGAWIPGVSNYRMGRRRAIVAAKSKELGGTRARSNLAAEILGPLTSIATGGLAGAGIGAGLGAIGAGSDSSHPVKETALVGGALGAGAAALGMPVATLMALIKRRRTMSEQAATDTSGGRTAAKYLLPGVATYDDLKRLGASRNLIEDRAKKNDDKKDEEKTAAQDRLAEKTAATPIRSREDILPFLGLLAATGAIGSGVGATYGGIRAGLTDELPGENRRARLRKMIADGALKGLGLGVGIPAASTLFQTALQSGRQDKQAATGIATVAFEPDGPNGSYKKNTLAWAALTPEQRQQVLSSRVREYYLGRIGPTSESQKAQRGLPEKKAATEDKAINALIKLADGLDPLNAVTNMRNRMLGTASNLGVRAANKLYGTNVVGQTNSVPRITGKTSIDQSGNWVGQTPAAPVSRMGGDPDTMNPAVTPPMHTGVGSGKSPWQNLVEKSLQPIGAASKSIARDVGSLARKGISRIPANTNTMDSAAWGPFMGPPVVGAKMLGSMAGKGWGDYVDPMIARMRQARATSNQMR